MKKYLPHVLIGFAVYEVVAFAFNNYYAQQNGINFVLPLDLISQVYTPVVSNS